MSEEEATAVLREIALEHEVNYKGRQTVGLYSIRIFFAGPSNWMRRRRVEAAHDLEVSCKSRLPAHFRYIICLDTDEDITALKVVEDMLGL